METLSKGVSPLIKRREPSRRAQHHPSYDRKNFIFRHDFPFLLFVGGTRFANSRALERDASYIVYSSVRLASLVLNQRFRKIL